MGLGMMAQAADIRAVRAADPRNISNGRRIPALNYVDQPYAVVTSNGNWVCVMTTGKGLEGQAGQHVVSTVSGDQGKTWSPTVDIEPEDGPEASWATPLLTPSGRIYVFYVYNGEHVVTLPNSGRRIRSDTHGWYVFRFSDDGGLTWSAQRFRVPIRTTAVDRGNPWGGEVCHFWSIDKPKIANGKVYLALTKLGRYFMQEGEGWFIVSDNLLTERDPDKIRFRLLPEGERGIRSPALGSIQEEFNHVPLTGDALLAVCRLASGTPAQSCSRDGGLTWTEPVPMTYGPGKRCFKTPRACPRLFKSSDGRYLFWYHHHGAKSWSGRNPVFLSGGILKEDGRVHWSEPEVVLFHPNPSIRMSYPDLIEQDGRFWLTESQKTVARVHALDPDLLEGLWEQESLASVATNGLLFEKRDAGGIPSFPSISRRFGDLSRGGFSIELAFSLANSLPGKTLFSTLDEEGTGVRVTTSLLAGRPVLQIELSDGHRIASWMTDPGALRLGVPQHIVWICDYSAGLVLPVVNGELADGGEVRAQGWGRLPADLGEPKGSTRAYMGADVTAIRLYRRPLRVSEAVGNWRAK